MFASTWTIRLPIGKHTRNRHTQSSPAVSNVPLAWRHEPAYDFPEVAPGRHRTRRHRPEVGQECAAIGQAGHRGSNRLFGVQAPTALCSQAGAKLFDCRFADTSVLLVFYHQKTPLACYKFPYKAISHRILVLDGSDNGDHMQFPAVDPAMPARLGQVALSYTICFISQPDLNQNTTHFNS
jgi:hypothetical protein